MSGTTDRIKGAADQAIGKVKETVGHAVGSPKTEVDGQAQQLKGKAETAIGKAKDAVKDTVNKNL